MFIQHTSNHTTIVLVYVDEIIVTRSSATYIKELTQSLNVKFPFKDLEDLHLFLGIKV